MKAKVIFPILTVLMVILIWAHSFMPADMSADESGLIVKLISDIFHITGSNTDHIVRKCAHFSEYFVLGILVAIDCALYLKKIFCLFPVFCGLLTPQIDETIQLFSPGRSGELFDVWLDFSGYMTGLIFVGVIYCVLKKSGIKQKNN